MTNTLKICGFLGIVTLLLVGCGASLDSEPSTGEVTNARLTRVGVRTIKAEPFAHSFAVQGNVKTDRIAHILASFPGVVREVLVEEGATVMKGQALVKIDTEVLAKQRAELLTQLDLAKTLFERQERLWKKEIGSEVDYLQSKAALETLEQSLATLDEQIDQAVIRAPFAGVLDRTFVNVGEMAAPPMPVVRVVDLSDLYVRAAVSDHYAGVVMAGQPVRIEARGLDPVDSEIRRVGQFIEEANRTIDLTVDLPSGARALPNMVVTIYITDLALDSALALPAAMVLQDATGQEYVYVVRGEKAIKQLVETGVVSEGRLLIEQGLKPGDRVIDRGASRVVDGERVSVIES